MLETEVKKIIENKNLEFPMNVAMSCAYIMAHYKGINLKVYKTKGSSLCDFNIICSVTNDNQARAIADQIEGLLKKLNNTRMLSREGDNECDWVLLDMGDVIAHVFKESTREIYDLDFLWKEDEQIEIPSSYYFSTLDEKAISNKEDETSNYF